MAICGRLDGIPLANELASFTRAQLTAAVFQAEQAAGRALPLEQAVALARQLPVQARSVAAAGEKLAALTGREQEVAVLIAEGRSNGDIAAELVLSKLTVEKHIANILSKLALTNRAQIVRWAFENGLHHDSDLVELAKPHIIRRAEIGQAPHSHSGCFRLSASRHSTIWRDNDASS